VINHSDGMLGCKPDGEGWCFKKCIFQIPVFMTHVFTTMQTAGIVRAVFVKTTKQVTVEEGQVDVKEACGWIKKLMHNATKDSEENEHDICPKEHERIKHKVNMKMSTVTKIDSARQ
jgi:hypothetical protein